MTRSPGLPLYSWPRDSYLWRGYLRRKLVMASRREVSVASSRKPRKETRLMLGSIWRERVIRWSVLRPISGEMSNVGPGASMDSTRWRKSAISLVTGLSCSAT